MDTLDFYCFDTGCDDTDAALTSIALLSRQSDGSLFSDWRDFWNWLLAMIAAIEKLPDDHPIRKYHGYKLYLRNDFVDWPAKKCDEWYSDFCDKLRPALREFSS